LQERVQRKDDGSYVLEKPTGFRHDGALVSDAVQLLGSLRAERWVAASPEAVHGLSTPRLRVELEPAGVPRRQLVVGAPTESGYFATLSPDPGVFVLARSVVQQLERPLLDRSLCPLPRAALARIELRQGKRELTLHSRGESWEGAGVGSARAAELGEALASLRAEFTVHLGAPKPNEGFARPSLTLRFFDAGGQGRSLVVGARDTLNDAGIAYARLDGVDATFAVSASIIEALQDF
jgi:hypothetical protein